MPMPGEKAPALSLPTLEGGQFDLDRPAGPAGTLLVFYRGLHCPLCIRQLGEIEAQLDRAREAGAGIVAISTDDEERARETARKAGTRDLTIAHSLSLAAARFDWGLWISSARPGSEEPALFSEPGMFWITPERALHCAWVQSAPFARPAIGEVLSAIEFQREKDYPPRGTYNGSLDAA